MAWPVRRAATPWAVLLTLAAFGCTANRPSQPAVPAPATVEIGEAPSLAEGEPEPDVEPVLAPAGSTERGWLGVELRAVEEGQAGVLVRNVIRQAPGELAGLQPGDVILQIDGQTVARPDDVVRLVQSHRAGDRLSVGFRRGTQDRLVAAVLAPMPNGDQIMRQTYVGVAAPRLAALTSVQGSLTPGLDALKGKVAVLEFWASWCGVCPIMVPTMNDWYARFGAQGFEVVGVTTDSVGVAASAAAQQGMSYPVWSDGSGRTTELYRALALPTVFVIDRNGVVRDVLVGYSSSRLAELEALVGRLLAQR
jgi:peroxiredoxin